MSARYPVRGRIRPASVEEMGHPMAIGAIVVPASVGLPARTL